jgi:hypothetical protein
LRCDLPAGFFAAVTFACFLPAIGISISFCPADALRGFLAPFFGASVYRSEEAADSTSNEQGDHVTSGSVSERGTG